MKKLCCIVLVIILSVSCDNLTFKKDLLDIAESSFRLGFIYGAKFANQKSKSIMCFDSLEYYSEMKAKEWRDGLLK